jgi:mono/diheme cytochrome c family protein
MLVVKRTGTTTSAMALFLLFLVAAWDPTAVAKVPQSGATGDGPIPAVGPKAGSPASSVAAEPLSASRFSRVRSSDPEMLRLIADAAEHSYTVRRLLSDVEHSNLIVYASLFYPPRSLPTSQTRLLGGVPHGGRYLSLCIDVRLMSSARIEMLGHELQHVMEIAAAPEVANDGDLLKLYRRIGYNSWNALSFETRGALVVQSLVAEELKAEENGIVEAPTECAGGGAAGMPPGRLFGAYCAACHGPDGRGKGPAAGRMRSRPPDLTQLAKRSGGEFPRNHVEARIRAADRTPPVTVTDGMPVWYPVSSHETENVPATRAGELAAFVESLQRR